MEEILLKNCVKFCLRNFTVLFLDGWVEQCCCASGSAESINCSRWSGYTGEYLCRTQFAGPQCCTPRMKSVRRPLWWKTWISWLLVHWSLKLTYVGYIFCLMFVRMNMDMRSNKKHCTNFQLNLENLQIFSSLYEATPLLEKAYRLKYEATIACTRSTSNNYD